MSSSCHHTFRKIIANTQQLEELQLNSHQAPSVHELVESTIKGGNNKAVYNDEDNNFYVLGYN